MPESECTWVDRREGLAALAAALAAAPEHALDCESNSGFAYRERTCLLQLNVGGRLWLVDLMALPREAAVLEPLREPLESRSRRTLVHGGEYDVGLLKRDFGIALGGAWDSQQAASLLGWPQTGYGKLVERLCGVTLPKGHAFTDWSRRPLGRAAVRYALDDVRYLPAVCERLVAEVRAADLVEELEIACAAVEEATWNGGYRPDGFWRIKGVRQLDRRRLPLLVALWEWREQAAEEADEPPGRLLNNALLLALARAAPERASELRRLGLRGRRAESLGPAILATLRAARQSPPEVPERQAATSRPDPEQRRRSSRLRAWRRQEAARRGVTEQAVLPAAALRHLAEHGSADLAAVPQLGGKRIGLYGEKLAALCA